MARTCTAHGSTRWRSVGGSGWASRSRTRSPSRSTTTAPSGRGSTGTGGAWPGPGPPPRAEPASALDPRATLQIEELMRELSREYTIVVVTHNMQQAARASDRTVFLTLEEDRAGYVV